MQKNGGELIEQSVCVFDMLHCVVACMCQGSGDGASANLFDFLVYLHLRGILWERDSGIHCGDRRAVCA